MNSIILYKCFRSKLWENSPFVSKQLSGIGNVLSRQLVNAGKTSFDKILESNPRDLEVVSMKTVQVESIIVLPVIEYTTHKVNTYIHIKGMVGNTEVNL